MSCAYLFLAVKIDRSDGPPKIVGARIMSDDNPTQVADNTFWVRLLCEQAEPYELAHSFVLGTARMINRTLPYDSALRIALTNMIEHHETLDAQHE